LIKFEGHQTFDQKRNTFLLFACLKGQCHEDFAVLGQFCAKIITLRPKS